MYISSEEFSEPERLGKVGTILWPEWHYGVLLLYGQNLAMNHLITSNHLNITKLENLIDHPSTNQDSIFKIVHIHVYHDDVLFSKFRFKDGKYDNYTLPLNDTTMVKYYCLSIALEAKRTDSKDLFQMFKHVSNKKKSRP